MKILLSIVVAQFLTFVVFAWFNRVAWIQILAPRQPPAVYKRNVTKPVLAEFISWHKHGRVHQGLKGIPDPDPALSKPKSLAGRLVAFPVLNGLHHDYRLVA